MNKRAALIATAIVIGLASFCGLLYLAFDGCKWAMIVLAVLGVAVIWGGFYWSFKD